MSVRISPNLPANVVEIGNEISQAKINEINAGTLALQTYVTSRGYITDAPANGNQYARVNNGWAIVSGGGGGSASWGGITGVITNQTDLVTYVNGRGFITEAPADGFSYVRQMGSWTPVGASAYDTPTTQQWVTGQGYIGDAPSDGNVYARINGSWASLFSGSEIAATQSYVGTAVSGKADTSGATEISVTGSGGTARLGVSGSGAGAISVTDASSTNTTYLVPTGITFPDSTTQTTAYTGGGGYSNDKIKADFILNNLQYWGGYYGMFNFPAMPMFINNISVGTWGIWDNNTSTGIAFSYGYSSGNQMALYFGGSLSSGNLSVYINSTYSSYSV
jgi:hypothetical protein